MSREHTFEVTFVPPDDLPLRERKKLRKKRIATLEQVIDDFRKALYRWESAEGHVTSWKESTVSVQNPEPNGSNE